MKVRVPEHQEVSPRIEKPVKGIVSTSVRDHVVVCYHQEAWDSFRILGSESNKLILELKKTLLF